MFCTLDSITQMSRKPVFLLYGFPFLRSCGGIAVACRVMIKVLHKTAAPYFVQLRIQFST